MFGDITGYYPCILMTYGSTGSFHYAVTTDNPISSYWDSQNDDANLDATIHLNTAMFASAIASDIRAEYPSVSNPYAVAPLRTGDYWTICMVLLSKRLTGASGEANHHIASGDTIVFRIPIMSSNQNFGETFAKSNKKRSGNLALTMELATQIAEWLPKARYARTEAGKHHPFPFDVYETIVNGTKVECKVAMKHSGAYVYTMRIIN